MGVHEVLNDEELERVSAPVEAAWTLPPKAYTDAAVYELEVERIFRRDWVALARVEQLPETGAQLPVTLAGQPLVLVRDDSGMIRALSNVCTHRSMTIVEEPSTGRFLTCPYHLWSFDLSGHPRTTPLMDGAAEFDPLDHCLTSYPVEIWQGFVFVSLDLGAEPLAPRLAPLVELLAPFRFADRVVASTVDFDSPWNWKLLVENFMEAHHHIGPHRQTLQPRYPAADSYVLDNDAEPWAALRMPGDGIELIAAVVFPTLLLAGSEFGPVWYQLDVDAHDHFHLRTHLLADPDHIDDPEFQAALTGRTDAMRYVHIEDISVNEGPWKGLHAPSARQGRLGPLELAVWQLNQLWLDRTSRPNPNFVSGAA